MAQLSRSIPGEAMRPLTLIAAPQPPIIQHAIWLYLRFTLSYRDVEELLAERGLDISYETVRRWVLISEAMTARCSAPPSEPAKSAFLRVKASGRMLRSTTLLSISIRPSSRNRHRPGQRDRA